MIRSWGLVAMTGSAQPWFGAVTTAAIGLPAASTGIILVTVSAADSNKFQVGDRIYVEPGTANVDVLLIGAINTTTGVMSCTSEGNATTHTHATTIIIQLSIVCADIIVQTDAAAVIWLGSDSTVTNIGGGSAFYQLLPFATPAQPPVFRYSQSSTFNNLRTSDGWMIGTSTQLVAVSAVVI